MGASPLNVGASPLNAMWEPLSMWEPPPILGKMVSGISMTIVVGAICNDSPDYRERCWELCARANHQYTFWRVVKRVALTQYIGGPGQMKRGRPWSFSVAPS